MQQVLSYADLLDIPSVCSSNGDSFFEHDRACSEGCIERELSLEAFLSPETLWQRCKNNNTVSKEEERIAGQDCFLTAAEARAIASRRQSTGQRKPWPRASSASS